ncbi:MAG: hypothetical protein C4558_08050 [Dehalococcoidia bacterium]|nr:MAG: hypothetical protein C4558_08050 [Dehalococcoidia bacterium]
MTPENISSFAFLVAGGMLAALAATRLDEVSWRYVRLVAALVIAVACSMLAWAAWRAGSDLRVWLQTRQVLGGLTGLAAIALLFGAPLVLRAARAWRVHCAVGGLSGVAAAVAWFIHGQPAILESPLRVATLLLSQLSAAALLGTVTATWLLGHAYLTATAMTVAPLRKLSRLFMAAAILRAAVAALGLGGYYVSAAPPVQNLLMTDWVALVLRVVVGLLAVGVFAWMVLGCVRWRNTQSATGILYFASVFVYTGELAGYYITGTTGWPV